MVYHLYPLDLSYTGIPRASYDGWGDMLWGTDPWGVGTFYYAFNPQFTQETQGRIHSYITNRYGVYKISNVGIDLLQYFSYTINNGTLTQYTSSGIVIEVDTRVIDIFFTNEVVAATYGIPYHFRTIPLVRDPLPYWNPTVNIPESLIRYQGKITSEATKILVDKDPDYSNKGSMYTHALLALYELDKTLNTRLLPTISNVPKTWRLKDINLIGRSIIDIAGDKYKDIYYRTNDLTLITKTYLRDLMR